MIGSAFKLFREGALDDFLAARLKRMQSDVSAQAESYILGVSPEQYEAHLVSAFTVEVPEVDFEHVEAERREVEVRAEQFPSGFWVERGDTYRKPSFLYFFPFTGSQEVLRLYPNPRIHWSAECSFQSGCLCAEFVCFHDNTNEVRREFDEFRQNLSVQLGHMGAQIREFNAGLSTSARGAIRARRDAVLKRYELAESLGVPLRRSKEVPSTFRVPIQPLRPKIVPRPAVPPGQSYRPEPTLDLETYRAILQNIYEFGKAAERKPSTYVGKSEEALRDFLLMHLEPNFEGSATGETFNRTGKTDILLRYEGSNVFVAECKFWSGEKALLAAMDQLLRYLTWRDSKAAVIVFVDRADFSTVIGGARDGARKHPNFLRANADGGESWINATLHLPGDTNREVSVAILLFHLPKIGRD